MGSALEIVVKVSEVCNINCSYCYFFNGPDRSFQAHPRHMNPLTAGAVADYVRRAAEVDDLNSIRLVLHGGEPLMLGKRKFVELCDALGIGSYPVPTAVALQTNAMLVDEEWIEILAKFGIDVGVSVDGPPDYHDEFRVDHRGGGTHAQTAAGIGLLRDAHARGDLRSLGVICVVNPNRDARRIYRHLVDDLGFRLLAFNLPDADWSTVAQEDLAGVGRFLCGALDEWLADDDPSIVVRPFTEMLAFARSSDADGWDNRADALIVGVSSDGTLAPDDSFRMTLPSVFLPENGKLTLWNSGLSDFKEAYGDGPLPGLGQSDPAVCRSCDWAKHCRGGEAGHRYSPAEGKWRESVYCEPLKQVHGMLDGYLAEHWDERRRRETVAFGVASA
ncbi:MAG: uncharacterized protein QOK17_2171 [Sphingomonadales bacterium]|nr:uncharacterized protein [Sphingomonadales bacterium]